MKKTLFDSNYDSAKLERVQDAARALRVAIEDERDSRKGLAAFAADEIARDFMPLLGKINRYADAARNEMLD